MSKISALPELANPTGAERVVLWDGAGTKQAALVALVNAILGDNVEALAFVRYLRSAFVETAGDGVLIPDLRIGLDQLPADYALALAWAKAMMNGVMTEGGQDGLAIAYGDGEWARLNAAGLSVRMAPGTIGSLAFGAGGVRSIRHALPGAFPGTLRQTVIDGRQQILAVAANGTQTRLSDGSADDWLEGLRGSVVAFTSNRNDGVELAIERAYTMRTDGKNVLRQSTSRRALICVYMGESLVDGAVDGAIPYPRASGVGTVMMSNGGVRLDNPDATSTVVPASAYASLVPLVEAGKQTWAATLGDRIWREHGIHSSHINVAVSGQKFDAIGPTTNPFGNGIAALAAHVAHWREQGIEPEPVLFVEEAVNDSNTGTDYTWAQGKLRALQNAFTAAARTALGLADAPIHMFFATPMSVGHDSPTGAWVAGGTAEFGRDNAFAHYAGPFTGIPNADTHHQPGAGVALAGDTLWYRPLKRVVIDRGIWTELRPKAGSGVRAGTSLTFMMEGFTGQLVQLVDADSPAIPNLGWRLYTAAGNEVAITGVTLNADSTPGKVAITAASDPGAGALLIAAGQTFGTTNAPADRARTNVADQDPLTASIGDKRAFPKRLGQSRFVFA